MSTKDGLAARFRRRVGKAKHVEPARADTSARDATGAPDIRHASARPAPEAEAVARAVLDALDSLHRL